MNEEYGLLDPDNADAPGDEWEEIDVSDTEADRIARRRDREFNQFRERIKDSEQFKVEQSVFDDATLAALYKLVQDGYVQAFGGPISSGKEATVYSALGDDDEHEEVAVKIYRISASNFRDMREYLVGDPRFEELGGDKKRIVLAWVRKEFANLERARKAGVRVPEPIAVQRNVLVMEFMGNDGRRAPTLADARLENPRTAFEVVREYMRRLFDAGLVHGDLSEYNILVSNGELCIIDVGQAVTFHHPNSGEFLTRDCVNVASFFRREGIDIHGDELEAWIRENAESER
ncbi:RIO-like serine/threonine protein kinase II [Haladaptatus paucihalophilus DX253]|uniref:non-specific serine/threonine protein kinase n=1 Tax=Haladaptatus paucihalophilus DX253 TaxID=797209 RepID=E7QNA0_HALPU|nr:MULTISPECIES: serine/threonine-protein kinase Rio1 [Haladaptatus]EFW93895.1 RIO-like serine/threonine protein kinase II [Haladaptatus paucihalophilus DX253]GKZ13230.1 serine/threonine protein kinase [Haladaptatus sp. T7]SHK67551.1 RIO kinase 1 [Haladaptatus paucihalophilus DX253]